MASTTLHFQLSTLHSFDVETICRRVNPDDWDGDGLANEKDENPLAYDGEFFGAANAMPTNANLDAYYQLDVAAVGALDFATIRVTCDGPSDLGDHVVIARTNQVCHVPLLAGATYAVESDQPIAYSAVSSEHAHIVTNSTTNLTVSLPLEFSVERIQMRDESGASNYGVRSMPINVYPDVSAVTGGCCTVTGGEACFSWSCSGNCRCSGGDHALWVSATWEGYGLVFPANAGCPCSHIAEQDENGASIRISFSDEVLVFENEYTNMLGDVVSHRSTSTKLSCRADGGRFGGTVAVTLSDGGRLLRTQGTDLPGYASVPAEGTVMLSVKYRALSESLTSGDIVATAVFTENMTGRQLTNTTSLTSVKVEVVAQAGFPLNKVRHIFGPQEVVEFSVTPTVDGIHWLAGGTNVFCDTCNYVAPIVPTNDVVSLAIGTLEFDLGVDVIPPSQVEAIGCIVAPTNIWIDKTGDWPHPGDVAVGMIVELRLLPDYVSFKHLFLQEGECPATNIWGFFEPHASNILPHDANAGAWAEVKISETNNLVGVDFPSANFGVISTALASGGFEYGITNYWYVKSNGTMIGQMHPFSINPSVFTISADGSLTVERFGCIATRGTNDVSSIIRSP